MKSHTKAGVFLLNSRWRPKWASHIPWGKFKIPSGFVLVVLALASGVYFVATRPRDSHVSASANSSYDLPGEWLVKYFRTGNETDPLVGGAQGDPDGDVLTNLQEYLYGTDPTRADTDGDGDIDSYEVAFGQNPNGENILVHTAQAQDYFKQIIEGNEQYSQFSEANIAAEVNRVLKPDQAVVLDFPADSELVITKENNPAAFEKYFENIKELMATSEQDFQNVAERLFGGMSDAEIDSYIENLQATETVMKKIPVPSEIANIQRLKVAGGRAGVKMFELVRDRYNADTEDPQFWTDLFNQMVAIETAGTLEAKAWQDLGTELKDTGGWEEIAK